MRLAFVYDRVNKFGGAERVLLALHKIWPKAPLFTSVYNPKTAPWAKSFKVIYSFAQSFPLVKKRHEAFPWLMPYIFESFNFNQFDVVISITSAEAKGIITQPKTLHICYCLTPTRYLWSSSKAYLNSFRWGILNMPARLLASKVFNSLRKWDLVASSRPDYYVAISKTVKKRIKKYYQRDSTVIYPPVNTREFKCKSPEFKFITTGRNLNVNPRNLRQGGYFLVVSRLVAYKKIDIIIKAFNILGLPLKIIGSGAERKFLEKISQPNIEFLGQNLTDKQLIRYYQNCLALVFAGIEDFGLVSLEAQACGRPVIAFNKGGLSETVINNKTGLLFNSQTVGELVKTVKKFKTKRFNAKECRENAKSYNQEKFIKKFKSFIELKWQNYQLKI